MPSNTHANHRKVQWEGMGETEGIIWSQNKNEALQVDSDHANIPMLNVKLMTSSSGTPLKVKYVGVCRVRVLLVL